VGGNLDARQMAEAFHSLRSSDLLWSRSIQEYLMGERLAPIDIAVWNADSTRMPDRLHSECLRLLVLENRMTEAFLLPIILMYTAWSYWVFRGKVRSDIGYH
jgi:poly(3-hydroxyalkanoate) synthetase